jgi:hypothetical protein
MVRSYSDIQDILTISEKLAEIQSIINSNHKTEKALADHTKNLNFKFDIYSKSLYELAVDLINDRP